MQNDEYGIPEGFFGPVAPELPALIGRVVMLSALLETKIWHLASSIGEGTQEKYARKRPIQNLRFAQRRILLYQENVTEVHFSQSVRSLLTEAEEILELRNGVVHGVWPVSGAEEWAFWKPRSGRRDDNEDWIETKEYSKVELGELVRRLVQLVRVAEAVIAAAGSMPARKLGTIAD